MNNEPKKTINPDDPFADIAELEDAKQWRDGVEDVGPADVHKDLNQATVARFEEECKACRGSGVFTSWSGRTVGPCFKCKGEGKRYFKTSPEVRAEQKRRRILKKTEQQEANAKAGASWLEANPDIKVYLEEEAAKENQWAEFPRQMLAALEAFGYLTGPQENAVRKGMARKADWAVKNAAESAERNARTADAELDLTGLLNAFKAAYDSGLKAPKLTVGKFRISRAKDHSKNPGYLYVNLNAEYYEDRTYYGKISPAGEFFAGRDCTDAIFENVKKLSGDVLAAAQAHGALTGNCSCCNRALTNEESVRLGIGPICRARWGL